MGAWFRKHRSDYPDDWAAIARHIKEMAGWRCLVCRQVHGAGVSVGVHHVDHDPANSADVNLLCLCARCHLRAHALRPRPTSRRETIDRLRRRYEADLLQLAFALY